MNIFDYLRAKMQKKTNQSNQTKAVTYKSNSSLHKKRLAKRAIKTISGILTVSIVAGGTTACSVFKSDQTDNLPTNEPAIIEPADSNINKVDKRPELVENIEADLSAKFGIDDLELESIKTRLENGSVVHKDLNGEKVIFVNFNVEVDGNSHTLTLPVDMNTYLACARDVNPTTTIIDVTKDDLLSMGSKKTSSISSMVSSACTPTISQEMDK